MERFDKTLIGKTRVIFFSDGISVLRKEGKIADVSNLFLYITEIKNGLITDTSIEIPIDRIIRMEGNNNGQEK